MFLYLINMQSTTKFLSNWSMLAEIIEILELFIVAI